ncbi:MAG TPA: cell surface protein SprA [Candidatus Saccharimonadales bacterium]|nr:cell surface protein SprA [Candidatus Saccharimonadales bacterium]
MRVSQALLLIGGLAGALWLGPGAGPALAAPPTGFGTGTDQGAPVDTSQHPTGDPSRRLKDLILYTGDPRRDDVEFDPDSGMVELSSRLDNYDLVPARRVPVHDYLRQLTLRNYDELFLRRSYADLGQAPAEATGLVPGRLKLELPMNLPGPLGSIFGNVRPNLALTGSETLTLGGTSNWDDRPQSFGRQSKFPQLEMKQDLQVKVQGSIGGKVKVDVDQTSNAAATPLSNRIRITYTGDQDEVVRSMELGNTQLSLPGTQFVSYSGQHQGLFGLKTVSKFGPLDLTVIASKQEGQSKRDTFQKSAQQQTERIEDYQYLPRQFFYVNLLDDDIDSSTISVYVDARTPGQNGRPGTAYLDPAKPDGPRYDGNFVYKPQIDFYRIHTEWRGGGRPILELNAPLDATSVLAVTYKRKDGSSVGSDAGSPVVLKMLRPYVDLLKTTATGDLDPAGEWYPTTFYELRNVYRLSGTHIDSLTFKLAIFNTFTNPPQDYLVDGTGAKVGNYIEITGLDNEWLNGSSYTPGQNGRGDGFIDGDVIRGRSFVDYQRGLIFFPDPRPFFYQPDPALPSGYAPSDPPDIQRPAHFTPDQSDTAIYTRLNYNSTVLTNKYYLEATYRETQASATIRLDRTDILPGSEVVTINGRRLERGTDYEITPELGEITILKPELLLGQPDISVDYAYASLFSTGQKALVGFSAAYGKEAPQSMATTWLFENSTTPDLRPQLGSEPSRTIVGDVNGQGRWKSRFLTRLVDAVPGLRATAESNISAQGEVALSLPNPNTNGLAYIDDMEGTKDVTSVDLGYASWKWSSLPATWAGNNPDHQLDPFFRNGRLHFYNPVSRVREGDLKTNLNGTEANTQHRVLELEVDEDTVSDDKDGVRGRPLWAGIQQGLARSTLDLSTATDIEMWINLHPELESDRLVNPQAWPPGARLHIDLGLVSEDAMWSPNVPPNDSLDTESPLGASYWSATTNDVGLDGIPDAQEQGIGPRPGITQYVYPYPDLAGDDFQDIPSSADLSNENQDPNYWQKYMGVNGTENNRRFDTEDLDGNGVLDVETGYFEYSLPLSDAVLDTLSYNIQTGSLGWKLLRIPVSAFTSGLDFGGGAASWQRIKHVRIWMSGLASGNRLSLGQLDVVGNRWQLSPTVTNAPLSPHFRVSVVNNKDNSFYTLPPGVNPGVTQGAGGDITGREQSLSLDFSNLPADSQVSAYRLFQRSNSDYTLYQNLQFFLYGYFPPGYHLPGSELRFYIRLGNEDTTSYYEYSTTVPLNNWALKTVDFAALTSLKLGVPEGKDTILVSASGADTFRVRKRPSFNAIRRIEMGLRNVGGAGGVPDSGSLWVDELSLGGVRKDIGTAERFSLDANLSDFATVSTNLVRTSADFLNIGRSVGSGTTNSTFNFNMSTRLGKFLEPLGIQLPVNFSLSRTSSVPKFLTGSDVEYGSAEVAAQTTESHSYTVSASLQRTGSDSPWYLRYFVDAWNITGSLSRTKSRSPTATDTTKDASLGLSYATPAPRERFTVKIPLLGNFYPLPTGFTMSQSLITQDVAHYDRSVTDTTGQVLGRFSNRRTSGMVLTSGLQLLDNLRYTISSSHDLTLHNRWWIFNLGREVQRTHTVSFTQDLRVRGVGPHLDWSSSSSDSKTPDLSPDLSVHNFSNQGNMTVNMELPVGRLLGVPEGQVDTTGGALQLLRKALARLGSFTGSYTRTNSNNASRAVGRPPLAYLLGLSTDPQVSLVTSGSQQTAHSVHSSAQNSLHLGQVQIDTRYDQGRTDQVSGGARGGTLTQTWPDVRVNWGNLEKLLPVGKLATNVTATTNFSRQDRQVSTDRPTPDSDVLTSSWQPLFSIAGDLKNHDRFTLSSDRSLTHTDDNRNGGWSEDRSSTVHLNLKHTVKAHMAPAGQSGPDLGFRLRSDIDINFDATLQHQLHTAQLATGAIPPQSTTRLDINSTASYAFANNVRGTLLAGYSRNYNSQQDVTSHSIRLQATAGLSF